MSLDFDDILNAENAMKTVRVKIREMGREIYKMRNGAELDSRYAFERYDRVNFSGPEYSGEHGPHWGVGTPIISVTFFWSYQGGGDVEYVTFPVSYLGTDWRKTEQARLNSERAEKKKKTDEEKEIAAAAKEARDRETYEKLRERFDRT